MKSMETMLRASEVANLIGCDPRSVRRKAAAGKIECRQVLNDLNRPEYLIPLKALEPQFQQKYFDGLKLTTPGAITPDPPKGKPMDQYTAEEREEISFWMQLIKRWKDYRDKPGVSKADVDEKFVLLCKLEYPDREISVDTLYRRQRAIQDNDLDGLVDKRGKWKKGRSSIDETLWQAFLSFYLDESQHPMAVFPENRTRGFPGAVRPL